MGNQNVVRVGADWIRILEAAHASAESDVAWADPILDAAGSIFPRAEAVGMYVLEHGPELSDLKITMSVGGMQEMMRANTSLFELKSIVQAFHYPRTPVGTHLEIMRSLDATHREIMAKHRRGLGLIDAIGMVSNPAPGVVMVLWAEHEKAVSLNPYERRLLSRVALHLDAGYRLRRRPEALKAELTGDGRVLKREDDAPREEVLEAHAARIIEARSLHRRVSGEAIELWPALLSGRVSLVPRGGTRQAHYAVVENPPMLRTLRALSPTEADVLALAARGLPTKLVAYALGLAPSTVSARLASAAAKFGVASRAELVRIGSLLAGGPRQELPAVPLTPAERDILELLQRGLSNQQIATLRSRSVRTVANQVASLLRKTGNTTRRALVTSSPSAAVLREQSGMLAPSCAGSPRP